MLALYCNLASINFIPWRVNHGILIFWFCLKDGYMRTLKNWGFIKSSCVKTTDKNNSYITVITAIRCNPGQLSPLVQHFTSLIASKSAGSPLCFTVLPWTVIQATPAFSACLHSSTVFLRTSGHELNVTPRTGGSLGRFEFDSDRTITQGLKITE